MLIAEPLEIAIQQLSKLPGIGRKTALRLSLFILRQAESEVENLTNSLRNLKLNIRFCKNCFNLATEDICPICDSANRQSGIICIVEEINDVIAIEKTNEYKGLYHVLGGVLSPLDGIGPDNLTIKELLQRIDELKPQEIILAMNPTTEGEATALYIANLLQNHNLMITRIARGLPIGSDLEFADEATVTRALEGRIQIK
ncbi:MAG: recombination mediator RecR [Bacteroidetes bacterium]|nr:recombination mediator RecR [Bacteroidota bacterium]MBU2584376.1 recombination mediator RecR [Bacteroidota bacterium]